MQDNAPDTFAEVVTGNLVWRELRKHAAHNWIGGGGTDMLEAMMVVLTPGSMSAGVGLG